MLVEAPGARLEIRMNLTDEQIADRLAATAEERTGYERRLMGAQECGDFGAEDLLKARIDACDQQAAWLKAQRGDIPAEKPAKVEREKAPAEKQTRLKGAGKQTRAASKSEAE